MPVWVWPLAFAAAGVVMLAEGAIYLYFGPDQNNRNQFLKYFAPGIMVLALDFLVSSFYLVWQVL
jgi:hypothetical protein